MHKHINKLNLKHIIFKHKNTNIMISDTTEHLYMINHANIDKVILFNINKFNSKCDVINYVKKKFLD
tara:strand:+ start:268 stop:468 length:201 start_codon:yes stop_codon:yes gene_type:complete